MLLRKDDLISYVLEINILMLGKERNRDTAC